MIGIGQPLFISPLRPAQGEGLSATITYDAAQILRTDDTPSEMNLAPFSLQILILKLESFTRTVKAEFSRYVNGQEFDTILAC